MQFLFLFTDYAIIAEAGLKCLASCEVIPNCALLCVRSGFNPGKCYPPDQYCCCET